MRPESRVLRTVETLGPRARLIRLAATLDPAGAGEVARLLDGQLDLARTGRCPLQHLVIDVAAVDRFAPGGLTALLPVRDRARAQDVAVHVSGCAERAHLLPAHVRDALTEFDPFLTAAYPPA